MRVIRGLATVSSVPTELVKADLGHPEMVADLMEHGLANLDLSVGPVQSKGKVAGNEHRDPVGHGPEVAPAPLVEGHTFVQAEQCATRILLPGRSVFHHNDKVVDLILDVDGEFLQRGA